MIRLTPGLTKENFWNDIAAQFPKATQLFCNWIDEYKKEVGWNKLFNSDSEYQNAGGSNAPAPKFHDLPYEMQVGIWINFADHTLNDFYEQPEYEYCMDLEADIQTVFKEIEPDITAEDLGE